MNQMVLYPALIKRDNSRHIVVILTGSGGSSTAIAFNVTIIMIKMATTTTTKMLAVEVWPLLCRSSSRKGSTALAWLSLVEYFGDN